MEQPNKLAVAQHLLTQTYPSLKDPKILISVLQNVMEAIDQGIAKALEQARKDDEIPPYSDTFNGRLTAMKLHLAKKKDISPIDFMMISEIQEILQYHKDAPVEFRKKQSLVMADSDYQLRTLTAEKTKTYIDRTKSLLTRL